MEPANSRKPNITLSSMSLKLRVVITSTMGFACVGNKFELIISKIENTTEATIMPMVGDSLINRRLT
jgi:hypothetical protein